MYGGSLPSGVYVFDFKSCCPSMLNIANSRDFIDSENLSEFWLRLTTSGVATAKVFTETATALAGIGA
jgi:hypothetical protein